MNFVNTENTSPENDNSIQECRLCLTIERENLLYLFSTEAEELNLISKLSIHGSLIITEEDVLPKSICFSCLNEINKFSDFYNRIQQNQRLLLAKIPNVKKIQQLEEFEVIKVNSDIDEVNSILQNDQSCNEESEQNISEIKKDYEFFRNGKEEHVHVPSPDYSSKDFSSDDNTAISEKDHTFKAKSDELVNLANIDQKSTKKWLKDALKYSKNKENLKNLLEEYTARSKILVLPLQKSGHRISLDEPIREFFDLTCRYCNSAFLTFVSMKKHMETQHNEQGFVMCCSKKIYRREAIMEHISFHLNPNQFICHICKQVCKSKTTLKIHVKQHIPEDQRQFKCEICNQSFVLNSQLKRHEKSHLKDEEKKYVCDKCGKAFAFKFVLEKHTQHKHIKQKNFMCEICARSFVDKVNLTAHKRIHDDNLPRLQCTYCDALLKNKVTLKIHMRTHNPENHSCNKCDKVLSTKNALMNHMQYAHGGKQYPCAVCEKVFKKSLTLKEHMSTHTGESLYTCKYCDKSFNAKANMYAHVKKSHREEWAKQKKLKWGTVS